MIYILRTVPLHRSTRNAWRQAGATIIRRKGWQDTVASLESDDVLINLGWRKLPETEALIFNHPDSVRAVSRPADLRDLLGDFLPPPPQEGDEYWIKNPGWAGNGKIKVEGPLPFNVPANTDVQKHISGVEYRVNSVGNKIVQAHVKEPDEEGWFDYKWIGVKNTNGLGIIPRIKEAVKRIPYGDSSILGWDWMIENGTDQPYLLEINTSAGVNEPTANRIISAIYNSCAL